MKTEVTEALTMGGAAGSPLGLSFQKQSQFSSARGKGREGAAKEEGTDAGTLDPAHGAELNSQDSEDKSSSGAGLGGQNREKVI